MLKAYLHISGFNGRSKFSTCLYRIAYNTFSDWFDSAANNGKYKISLESGETKQVISEDSGPKDYSSLYKAIEGLSENEKVCTFLHIVILHGKPFRHGNSFYHRHARRKYKIKAAYNRSKKDYGIICIFASAIVCALLLATYSIGVFSHSAAATILVLLSFVLVMFVFIGRLLPSRFQY